MVITTTLAASASTRRRHHRQHTTSASISSVFQYFMVLTLLFAVLNIVIHHQQHIHNVFNTAAPAIMTHHLATFAGEASTDHGVFPFHIYNKQQKKVAHYDIDQDDPNYQLAGLSCDRYGGPLDATAAAAMVYWHDIPADNAFVSPFHQLRRRTSLSENNGDDNRMIAEQYLTFEPDHGGWNNIRMAMETVLSLAFAMGRTLVLPPSQRMYLLNKDTHENEFTFDSFFHMEAIHNEHVGLNIVTMDEFLQRATLQGLFRHGDVVLFPPGNRTDWNGANANEINMLYRWLRKAGQMVVWNSETCLAAFPVSPQRTHELESIMATIQQAPPKWEDFVGHPGPVNADTLDRLRESWADRSHLCLYNETWQAAPVLHFPVDQALHVRLLTHFYTFLFFQDYQHDLFMKRFVRDHVRYVDEIQCAAARVVQALAAQHDAPVFDTLHVRRGDFQYTKTRLTVQQLYAQTSKVLPEGATVYIATDERNKSYFGLLKQHYQVLFLDDFMHVLQGVNSNYYGMIDQLVASKGRYFFGCWFSTFTGYINRLRGYHANNAKVAGYREGILDSWYYALPDRFDHMRTYYPIKRMFYAREFPTSWRLLETDIEDFHAKLLDGQSSPDAARESTRALRF